MKKTFVITIALVLCGFAFAGCGDGQPGGVGQGDVNVTQPAAEPDTEPDTEPSGEPAGGPPPSPANPWYCVLQEADVSSEITGYLRLEEDGRAAFDYGDGYGPAGMGMVMYRGRWHTEPGKDGPGQPWSLVLDLALDCAAFEGQEGVTNTKNSTYAYELYGEGLILTYIDGDPLYFDPYSGDDPPPEYLFIWDGPESEEFDLWKMSDSELSLYMRVSTNDAADYFDLGMKALVSGDLTELPNGEVGRDVWLGTDHDENFVKEVLFAVSISGATFKYDPVTDDWSKVS